MYSSFGRLPIEADADERELAKRRANLGAERKGRSSRSPDQIPEDERDYYLERRYPSFGNLVPRDVASRNAKKVCDEGRGVGETGLAVYLDFAAAIKRRGAKRLKSDTATFSTCTADHGRRSVQGANANLPGHSLHDGRLVGGLQPDEHHPRDCHVLGEANFSDHGANRLGASALMQGLSGRLLRDSVHGRRLSGNEQVFGGERDSDRSAANFDLCERDDAEAAEHQGHADGGFIPPAVRQDCVGLLRDVSDGGRIVERDWTDPRVTG